MAQVSKDEFLDDKGRHWTLETVLDHGGAVTYLTTPTGETRKLRPRSKSINRPSVDAETPLPLENL